MVTIIVILSVLIYAVIKLICMGIFYHALRKYNYIISLIVYLVINAIINKLYMTISGSILLDLLFNFIKGVIIIIVYRKNIKMEDIKWFAIIGIMIDTILTFFLGYLWKLAGLNIFIYISIFGTLFSPYIIGIILSAIVICLIRKKLIKKDKKLRNLIYVAIIIFCVLVSRNLGYSFILYKSAEPDKLYIKMNEMNDNKSLIGLSKEQVIELLGEPYSKNDKDEYYYDAGKITNHFFFGERDFYELIIFFDDNDIVQSTSTKMIT